MRRATAGERIANAYGMGIVALRFPIVIGWVAALVLAVVFLPPLGGSRGAPLDDIVPADARALQTQERIVELFGGTLATDSVVVQRNPEGLSRGELERLAGPPLLLGEGVPLPQLEEVKAALPLVNVPLPGVDWNETGTTALTYLFLDEQLSLKDRLAVTERYADSLGELREGTTRGVTGAGPARLAQFDQIEGVLPLVTGVTILLIVLIVAVTFRSIGAPLVTLFTAGVAYLLAVRALGGAGELLGVSAPSEIEPVLVVLLLGLVTDYTIFFLAEARRAMMRGAPQAVAARQATRRIAPIVLTAGTLVAACAACLLAGQLQFFRVFGPGLALAALVVTVVCVTLAPALVAVFGDRLFGRSVRAAQRGEPDTLGGELPARAQASPRRERWRMRLYEMLGSLRASRRAARREGGTVSGRFAARLFAGRVAGGMLAALSLVALVLLASGAQNAQLAVSFIPSLPEDDPVRVAAERAGMGFVAGVMSPTDLLLEQGGLDARAAELGRLQRLIMREPGIGGVIGPAQAPDEDIRGLVVTEGGRAARFTLFLEHEPTGRAAIDTLQRLQGRLPALAREAGLGPAAHFAFAGETALSMETVDRLLEDLRRVAVAIAIVTFVLLALFLRSLIAPFLLLIGSALAFAAAFGVTSLLLPDTLGGSDFAHYVPLVAGVLLIGLGSDYNVFIAGRIREEARRRRHREAIAVGAPAASRAITVAGITLAASFAVLALVPLRPFRELAMLMSLGVLMDALFVRPVLIPSLLAVTGRFAWWPWQPRRRLEGEAFLEAVARRTGRPPQDARATAIATLSTLAERVPPREAEEISRHLPADIAAAVEVDPARRGAFPCTEFVDRVAQRTRLPREDARADAEAVIETLVRALPQEEVDYLRAALPHDYRGLLGDDRRRRELEREAAISG